MLSKLQLQQLGIAATAAFARQEALDLLDLPPDLVGSAKAQRMKFWRQRECAALTGICSFRDLDNRHYLEVKGHFETLAGKMERAFSTALRSEQNAPCHRPPGCQWVRDMNDWAARAGFRQQYIAAVMKGKFRTVDLHALSERQLKQLHDTIVNRARAKLGLGSATSRNKAQRAPSIDIPF